MPPRSNKCVYQNCGKSKQTHPDLHLFTFPVKKEERCKTWILNSGQMDLLDLPLSKLKTRLVCEDHFEAKCFVNIRKQRLIHTAVPTLISSEGSITQEEKKFCTSYLSAPIPVGLVKEVTSALLHDEQPVLLRREKNQKTYSGKTKNLNRVKKIEYDKDYCYPFLPILQPTLDNDTNTSESSWLNVPIKEEFVEVPMIKIKSEKE